MMAEPIPVQRGIPMPAARRPGPGKHSYPWHTMKVGESFVFPFRVDLRTTKSAAHSATANRQRTTREAYQVRTVKEKRKTVVRVWRVA